MLSARKTDDTILGKWCVMDLMQDDEVNANLEDMSEVIPRKFLNCRLCNEEFQDPKLLPCLHSFCHRCLSTYISNQRTQGTWNDNNECNTNEPVTHACPECGTHFVAEDPGHLPDNVLARRLSCPSEMVPPQDPANCVMCGQRDHEEVVAKMHCVNCEENICHSCANAHQLQEETASHRLEPLVPTPGDKCQYYGDGIAAENGDSAWVVLPRCCQCYDAYDIDSKFCIDCDKALCPDCHASHEAGHRCAELSAVAQNFVSKIQGPVEDLQHDLETLDHMLASLGHADQCMAKHHEKVQAKVRHRTLVLCGLIKEYETMLLQETERRHQHNLKVIQQHQRKISQHAASISAVAELTDKLVQYGSEEEKVAMRRKIGRRVRELCETDLPSKTLKLTKLKLQEPSITVETICNLFGELHGDLVHQDLRQRPTASQICTSDQASIIDFPQNNITREDELGKEAEDGSNNYDDKPVDADILNCSNNSDVFYFSTEKSIKSFFGQKAQRYKSDSMSSTDDGVILNRKTQQNNRTSSTDEPSMSFQDNNSAGGAWNSTSDGTNEENKDNVDEHDSKVDNSNSSFQSTGSLQENIPTQLLEEPQLEVLLPDIIPRDSVKGVGVNSHGDIIIATMTTASNSGSSSIYILEQHGIVRGQIPIEAKWNVHSVAADGRVTIIIARGDNRYKVKVVSEDGSGTMLADVHLESLGLNFTTATLGGCLLVASNRYARLSHHGGKAVKSGGNIAMYDKDGRLEKRITNEDLAPRGGNLLEKPHWITVDEQNNIFVADIATHCVIGFTAKGELLFQLGCCDLNGEELYQGPDSVCVDRQGHVLVTDKKEGRIDVVNYEGRILKSLFPSDNIRFVCPAPPKQLMLVTTEGNMKFYNYLD